MMILPFACSHIHEDPRLRTTGWTMSEGYCSVMARLSRDHRSEKWEGPPLRAATLVKFTFSDVVYDGV